MRPNLRLQRCWCCAGDNSNMTRRYELSKDPEFVRTWFRVKHPPSEWQPLWNIAPGQLAPVLRLNDDGSREIELARWGLLPKWSTDPTMAKHCATAMADRVTTQPAFRAAFKRRRCLVPATAFFTWAHSIDGRQPWRIFRANGLPMAFAGVWEFPHPAAEDPAWPTFAIIALGANSFLSHLSDRMPAIIEGDDHDRWLSAAPREAVDLLLPYSADPLSADPVSREINNPRNNRADLSAPTGPSLSA
jgi:putative SOS response-associated peptidase YedK